MKFYFYLIFVFFIGCSGISKNECKDMDFYQMGYQDAGVPKESENNKFLWEKHCKKHGKEFDDKYYKLGLENGKSQICTYEQGYMDGKNSVRYRETCPEEKYPLYTKGFDSGGDESGSTKLQNIQANSLSMIKLKNDEKSCEKDDDCVTHDRCIENACLISKNSCLTNSNCDISGVCENSHCKYY